MNGSLCLVTGTEGIEVTIFPLPVVYPFGVLCVAVFDDIFQSLPEILIELIVRRVPNV